MIDEARFHRGRDSQCFVNPDEVVPERRRRGACVTPHLSLRAPSARVELRLDKGRLFGASAATTRGSCVSRSGQSGEIFQQRRDSCPVSILLQRQQAMYIPCIVFSGELLWCSS